MSVRVVVQVPPPDGDGEPGTSLCYTLDHDYEDVLDRLMPENPPTNVLGQRNKMTYTKKDGGRVFIHPNLVSVVEEVFE